MPVTSEKNASFKGIDICSDGTEFYNYAEAKEMFSKLKPKKLTVSDCILVNLYAQPDKPIYGRVVLMKEVFLLIREVLDHEEVQDPKYVPYRLGMYSFLVANALTNLEYSGYLQRIGKKNTKLEQFMLTNKGKEHADKVWNTLLMDIQETAKEKRKGWDQLGYDGILRFVYRKYPEYKENSCLKERYKNITWGRGIG